MIFNTKSIKAKIFLSYSCILVLTILLFNAIFYYFSRDYFYQNTINSLESISRDVIADDILGKKLTDTFRFAVHKYEFSIKNVYIQANYRGKIVLKSKNLIKTQLPIERFSGRSKIKKLKKNKLSKYELIIYSTKLDNNNDYIVEIATTTEEIEKHLQRILYLFLFGDPIFIVVILILIYKMLQDLLKPMNSIIKTAKEISITDLDRKIIYKDNGDEFAELAKTFNNMLQRLHVSFNQVKRFTQDASHQLKTPLTSIRLQADVALKSSRSNEEYKSIIENIKNETIYLQDMISDLFLLSQLDDEIVKNSFTKTHLDTVVINSIEEYILLANKKGIVLDIEKIDHLVIKGDPILVSILCSNLIDNAIKYTPKGKKVVISLKNYTFTVRDEGIGIKEELLESIFDRFFRVNLERPENAKGFGLGLSIVKIISNLHNANIYIESKIDKGTKIDIIFPPYQ